MTPPARRLELLSDRSGSIRPFRNPPEVEAAARCFVAQQVVRNDPQATNDELVNELAVLLDMLGLTAPDAPLPGSS